MKPTGRAAQQRGVSGVLVIAVLVVLSAIGTFAVGLVSSVHDGQARALSHTRAVQAAQAGLDWGRWRISSGGAATCSAPQTLTTLPGTLQPYVVTVRCTASGPHAEGAATVSVYRIDATACNRSGAGTCPAAAPSADYVQASASALVER